MRLRAAFIDWNMRKFYRLFFLPLKISFCFPTTNNMPSFPCSIETIYFSLHPIKLVHLLLNSNSNQLTYTFIGQISQNGFWLSELCDDTMISKCILSKKLYQGGKCLLEPADIFESLIQMFLEALLPGNCWSKWTQ